MDWREGEGTRWLEAGLPGARAVFSTRLGGVSEGPWSSLNLGILTGDERDRVVANRVRLCSAIGIDPGRVVIGRQVHATAIARHEKAQRPSLWPDPAADPPELDGHVIDRSGLAALVFVADCLPIALAGPDGLAMLHCGWRGLAGGIVGSGAAAIEAEAAAIGPGIGPCCYEVGEEVLAAFAPLGPGVSDGRMLDLKEVARRLLERAGVTAIEDSGICTRCEGETFFSHRGEGPETGRQAGIVTAA
ncbi:MAG TPA: polyphenol oxidase family protein [Solirubrobacterales bacterium]|nr:polyphenol oxidase family protein [Solirubrobacterales bacterium]